MIYEGLMVKFNCLYLSREGEIFEVIKKKLSKFFIEDRCFICDGRRFNERVYRFLINGYNIVDLISM